MLKYLTLISSFNITISHTNSTFKNKNYVHPCVLKEDGDSVSIPSQRSAADSVECADHSQQHGLDWDDDIHPSDSTSRPQISMGERRHVPPHTPESMGGRPGYPTRDPAQSYTRQYYAYLSPYGYQMYVPHSMPPGFMPPGSMLSGSMPPGSMPPRSIQPTLAPAPGLIPPAPAPQPGSSPLTLVPPSLQGFHRRGTTDWETKKGTKRIRYFIPLRTAKKVLDEESGLASPAGAFPEAGRTAQGLLRGSGDNPVHEQFDILATQRIPDIEGREIISLTVKDKSELTDHKDLRYESRWRYSQDPLLPTFTDS